MKFRKILTCLSFIWIFEIWQTGLLKIDVQKSVRKSDENSWIKKVTEWSPMDVRNRGQPRRDAE